MPHRASNHNPATSRTTPPLGNPAIFYSDYAYSTGLIKLGTIEAGLEELAARQEDFTVSSEP